jgi:hypothetical protein
MWFMPEIMPNKPFVTIPRTARDIDKAHGIAVFVRLRTKDTSYSECDIGI